MDTDFVSAPDSEADTQPVDKDLVGTFDLATYGLASSAFIQENLHVQAAKNAQDRLTPENLGDIQTFDFIIHHRLGVQTYYAVQQEFVRQDLPNQTLPSLKCLHTKMLGLSGLKTVNYHCCKESCVLYTGYLANLTECPHCGLDCYNAAGAPQAVFTYIPLIPQLCALYCNPKTNKTLHYRANYKKDNELIEDIFDSQHYQWLCNTFVTIDGVWQPYKFFSDSCKLALGLSVDGMCPFKCRKNSCWPLIIINYNLPPEVCILLKNIICVGVVPGPHSPRDLNSFLQPLVEELVELAKGVKAVDILCEAVFSLCAHLIDTFGDIPALTKILEFLGHNAHFPCCFCEIMAIPGHSAKGGSHLYCPPYQPDDDPIDPFNLPLCTHEDTLQQGAEVLQIANATAAADKAKESGVKGVLSSRSRP
ncbi:hypothetical protein CTheo_8605 [Ceratobasidium theobromae]|uniref:Transposase family Tnp2 protein n=1 Tax=Ceratobasidium theobromae TaxID=1582974 RepID=A0A5N5Q8F4_9AGAM|nr:hypothetical protein CTheo_8605 [Ceratobasidium theobromae]